MKSMLIATPVGRKTAYPPTVCAVGSAEFCYEHAMINLGAGSWSPNPFDACSFGGLPVFETKDWAYWIVSAGHDTAVEA